jgi:ABC-2 type transport system ATP-binding protein
MIAIRGLSLAAGEHGLDSLSLEVADGEIVYLLHRAEGWGEPLFRCLTGAARPDGGEVGFDGVAPGDRGNGLPASFIDRVAAADFETEARLGDWIDLLCAAGAADRGSIYRTLLVLSFHEGQLRRKVRDLRPEAFQQVYLAACLARERRNVVINDFIRGAGKGLELKFNKLLLQQKDQGRAVLGLGSDIFSASEIADRVGFVKDGRLLFEAGASDLKEMDLKDLYRKFLN